MNDGLDALLRLLEQYRDVVLFGVATGRDIESTREKLRRFNALATAVIIASAGSEIYYGEHCHYGK